MTLTHLTNLELVSKPSFDLALNNGKFEPR